MKTEVLMKRELFGEEIKQQSKTEFFSATDLVKAGNKWRILNGKEMFSLKNWLSSSSTKEFIKTLETKYGVVKINSKGKNDNTWIHPYLFIDLALSINPELKIEVYSWIYDHLLEYRNNSGDSYKLMTGALYNNISNKSEFKFFICDTCKKIRESCNIEKEEDWQDASENQLKKRDEIQKTIARYCDILQDTDQVVNQAIITINKEYK